jgi:mitogen-activated protein kinase kinase
VNQSVVVNGSSTVYAPKFGPFLQTTLFEMLDTPSGLHGRRASAPVKLNVRIGSLANVQIPDYLQEEISAQPDSAETQKLLFSLSTLRRVSSIGNGASGGVTLVIYTPLQIKMACKILTIASVSEEETEEQFKQIQRELRILRKCHSEHVVTFFGAFLEEDKLHIMLEWMDLGSLDKILLSQGPIPEKDVVLVATQLLKGLAYIHDDLHVMHRDIKPGNMLLNSKGVVKISDFGISKERVNGPSSFCGTLIYLAPESNFSNPYY